MPPVSYEYNKERIKAWRATNPDRYREYQKRYMRERRLRIWEQQMAGLVVHNDPSMPMSLNQEMGDRFEFTSS
jgi:hypothetical protein